MSDRPLNPQQELFLQSFLDPKSETFGNYTTSAIKAGFSEKYADNISALMPKWLDEALEDSNIVRKAMDNLYTFIGDDQNKTIQWDATKFALSRLNKSKFSERTEHTGKDGKDITIKVVKYGNNDTTQI